MLMRNTTVDKRLYDAENTLVERGIAAMRDFIQQVCDDIIGTIEECLPESEHNSARAVFADAFGEWRDTTNTCETVNQTALRMLSEPTAVKRELIGMVNKALRSAICTEIGDQSEEFEETLQSRFDASIAA